MTASQAPRPLAPLPIRVRPQRAETTESYARRLARANHLRPSYLRTFLCDRHGTPERSAHGGSPPSPAVLSGHWNTPLPISPRAARPDGSRVRPAQYGC